ncbi:MAG: ABC transporter ATP-binding protein [Candidatus Aenigmatarchaeota archaeon]
MKRINVSDVSKKFRINKGPDRERDVLERLKIKKPEKTTIEALKNINFSVEDGEWFGVVGENGSGKTTLLKIIGDILSPSSGSVQTKGKTVSIIGLGNGFKEELSAKENIYLYGSLMGLSKKEIEERYDDIVSFSELYDYMNTKFKKFSDGMKMRLAFSTAMHVDADIFLSDEVISVGDGDFQRKCLEKLQEFKEQGKTIVLASHNLGSIEKWCDRSIFLNNGRVEDKGESREVVNEYKEFLRRKGKTEKLKKKKQEIIKGSDQNIKFYDKNYNETYIFRRGEYLGAEVKFTDSYSNAKVVFRGKLDDREKLIVYSNEGVGEWNFNLNKVCLHEGAYKVSLYGNGRKILEGIEVEVIEGDSVCPDLLSVPDPENKEKHLQDKLYVFAKDEDVGEALKNREFLPVYTTGFSLSDISWTYTDAVIADNCLEKLDEVPVEKAVQEYKDSKRMEGIKTDLKNKNKEKVDSSEKVSDLKIRGSGNRPYLLTDGGSIYGKLIFEKEVQDLEILFRNTIEQKDKLAIYFTDVGGELEFETDDLFLKKGKYQITVCEGGEVVLSGIQIQVFEDLRCSPDPLVIKEPTGEEKSISGGYYLFSEEEGVSHTGKDFEGRTIYFEPPFELSKIKERYENCTFIKYSDSISQSKKMDVDGGIERYGRELHDENLDDRLKEDNRAVVSKNDFLSEFKLFNEDEECYLFKQGEELRGVIELDEKTEGKISMELQETVTRDENVRFELLPRKEDEKRFSFDLESIFLPYSRYNLKIKSETKGYMAQGLEMEVRKDDHEEPKNLIFANLAGNRFNFPNDRFLLVNPRKKTIPELPVVITNNGEFLFESDKAYLFENGKFKEEIIDPDKYDLGDSDE